MLLKNENCYPQRISVSEEKVNNGKIHLHVCILQSYTSDVFISQCLPAIQTSLYLPAINMTLKSQKCYSQHVLEKRRKRQRKIKPASSRMLRFVLGISTWSPAVMRMSAHQILLQVTCQERCICGTKSYKLSSPFNGYAYLIIK